MVLVFEFLRTARALVRSKGALGFPSVERNRWLRSVRLGTAAAASGIRKTSKSEEKGGLCEQNRPLGAVSPTQRRRAARPSARKRANASPLRRAHAGLHGRP